MKLDELAAVLLILGRISDDTPAAPRPQHWLAVDRCIVDHADAYDHARRTLARLEGRPPHRVEVEAAVVVCPMGHDDRTRDAGKVVA